MAGYYRGQLVETMPRLRGEGDARIDYRHVIWSLVRKPGAFARYRYREELFPTVTFRRAYDRLRASRGDRADVEYVRVLHLAASTMEATVEAALVELLARDQPFDYAAVRALANPDGAPPSDPSERRQPRAVQGHRGGRQLAGREGELVTASLGARGIAQRLKLF